VGWDDDDGGGRGCGFSSGGVEGRNVSKMGVKIFMDNIISVRGLKTM
jgi:hypothetical protein